MKEKALKEELLKLGVSRGVLTFEELNYVFPAEFLPLDELEHFLKRLAKLGVKVTHSMGTCRVKKD